MPRSLERGWWWVSAQTPQSGRISVCPAPVLFLGPFTKAQTLSSALRHAFLSPAAALHSTRGCAPVPPPPSGVCLHSCGRGLARGLPYRPPLYIVGGPAGAGAQDSDAPSFRGTGGVPPAAPCSHTAARLRVWNGVLHGFGGVGGGRSCATANRSWGRAAARVQEVGYAGYPPPPPSKPPSCGGT